MSEFDENVEAVREALVARQDGFTDDMPVFRAHAALDAVQSEYNSLRDALRVIAELPGYDLNAAGQPSAAGMADIAREALEKR